MARARSSIAVVTLVAFFAAARPAHADILPPDNHLGLLVAGAIAALALDSFIVTGGVVSLVGASASSGKARSNWSQASIVLGALGIAAGVALTIALWDTRYHYGTLGLAQIGLGAVEVGVGVLLRRRSAAPPRALLFPTFARTPDGATYGGLGLTVLHF